MLPTTLQLYLSPRPARSVTHHVHPLVTAGGSTSTYFEYDDKLDVHYVRAVHRIGMKGAQGGKNAACAPPLHIHLTQDEYFKVLSGRFMATMNGESITLTKDDPEYHAKIGEPHQFWPDDTAGEDMEVRMRVSPEERKGFDECFYRNIWSYLNDCEANNMAPSPFQMSLFLYEWDMVLALPIPMWLNKALHHVMGYWIGKRLLGYNTVYEEYWKGEVEGKKTI
ncbi:hypothetical protein MNV49_001045 [Pseudohyphozyma bogoriensis]|nr:hypothetical protein MNV49_001045 [Pseudohyphozyma bogoriensis]